MTSAHVEGALFGNMKQGNFRFGLITQFHVDKYFSKAASENIHRQTNFELGYYMFGVDDNSKEKAYKWISYDGYKKQEKFRKELSDLKSNILLDLSKQNSEGEKKSKKNLKGTLKTLFAAEDESNPSPSSSNEDLSAQLPSEQTTGTHATNHSE